MRRRLATVAALVLSVTSSAGADDRATPTVATRWLLHELASGRRSVESLVDPELGVVYLDHAGREAARPDVDRRLCTAAERRRRLRWILRNIPAWLDEEDDPRPLACRNRPGPPTCAYYGAGEFNPQVTLTFELDPAQGLRLREVVATDLNGVSDEAYEREMQLLGRRRARLAATTCSPPSPPTYRVDTAPDGP